jgi:hypothetical protein
MTLRNKSTFVVATATLVAGVWLVTGGAWAPPVPSSCAEPGSADLATPRTYHSQVCLEAPPQTVATAATRPEQPVTSSVQLEGRRRSADLRAVLDKIDGEPVYVEGLDGPAPQRKR